jgi:hypothetical protein
MWALRCVYPMCIERRMQEEKRKKKEQNLHGGMTFFKQYWKKQNERFTYRTFQSLEIKTLNCEFLRV